MAIKRATKPHPAILRKRGIKTPIPPTISKKPPIYTASFKVMEMMEA